jgi:enoyl-[acyl-carrier protein] reductase III
VNSSIQFKNSDWALILGASSGFGAATAKELAKSGMNIVGIHLDRALTMPQVEAIKKEITDAGVRALFFNTNASDEIKRNAVLDELMEEFEKDKESNLRVIFHSLAFGSLKPFISDDLNEMITQRQVELTMDVMATSLIYWVQGAFSRGLMKRGGRVFGMTSSGGHSVLMNYGAVSAAKAALESIIRQLAMELGPYGITANAILAGVTDTPALRKIPGALKMIEVAKATNPQMRTTTPEDVAKAIALLSHSSANFISGNVIGVDGGEDIVNYIGQKNVKELE